MNIKQEQILKQITFYTIKTLVYITLIAWFVFGLVD